MKYILRFGRYFSFCNVHGHCSVTLVVSQSQAYFLWHQDDAPVLASALVHRIFIAFRVNASSPLLQMSQEICSSSCEVSGEETWEVQVTSACRKTRNEEMPRLDVCSAMFRSAAFCTSLAGTCPNQQVHQIADSAHTFHTLVERLWRSLPWAIPELSRSLWTQRDRQWLSEGSEVRLPRLPLVLSQPSRQPSETVRRLTHVDTKPSAANA